MSKPKKLFEPDLESNPFYKVAFNADFSKATEPKQVKDIFNEELSKLTAIIKNTLEPIKSVTQVTEIFHYGTLASVLLQQKAQLQLHEVLMTVAPEHSVGTMLMSQFKVMNKDSSKEIKERANIERYDKSQELAKHMEKGFIYTGPAMRSLVITATLSISSCKANRLANSHEIVRHYAPTNMLLLEEISKNFPVIGIFKPAKPPSYSKSYSTISYSETVRIERIPNNEFCAIFANKLAELLDLEDMHFEDRVRLEELRDFYLDTLCRFFFNVHMLNFPRILHFISVVIDNYENGRISEDVLNTVVPSECKALLGNEAIIIKDSVDMSVVWGRVNSGIKGFATLVKQFNLLSGYKQSLLDEAISKIK